MKKKIMKEKASKTALVLSGGGSKGAYEAGVWQALTELGKNIDMVYGTSVGAINGAMVAQGDLEKTVQLWREIQTHMIFDVPEGFQSLDYAKEIIANKGAGTTGLKKLMEQYFSEEKIRQSNVDFGVVTVELSTLTPHYVYIDDMKPGQLIDYVMASSSLFPALHSYKIEGREFIDGGYADVMPVSMAVKKGATEIIAVYLRGVGLLDHKTLKNTPNLTIIESKWDLGSSLIFDTTNARRIMRLGYLDTMKNCGVFDGEYFAFIKGSFDKTTAKMADAAARLFALDPCILYSKESLLEHLKAAMDDPGEELEASLSKYREKTLAVDALLELAKDLKDIANKQLVTLLIAENLKEKGDASIFANRTVSKLFKEYIRAGKFLVKYDLV